MKAERLNGPHNSEEESIVAKFRMKRRKYDASPGKLWRSFWCSVRGILWNISEKQKYSKLQGPPPELFRDHVQRPNNSQTVSGSPRIWRHVFVVPYCFLSVFCWLLLFHLFPKLSTHVALLNFFTTRTHPRSFF